MKASEALAVLVDPDNLIQSLVVVPEGARVRQIVKTIVDKTDITKQAVTAALAEPEGDRAAGRGAGQPRGLPVPGDLHGAAQADRRRPDQADGGQERARSRSRSTSRRRRRSVGLTPEQVLTVASILEYEANRSEDYPKVARVLYNRLDKGMPLQLDSTVSYVSQR